MRNRFPGICYRCGERVEVGAGHFEKIIGSRPTRWRTQHATCAIVYRGTGVGKSQPMQHPQQESRRARS